MTTNDNPCERATEHLAGTISSKSRFPARVLDAQWVDFFLFDSDWIFEGAFVDKIRSMLAIEGSSCVCLKNLDRAVGDTQFYIRNHTNADEFQRHLRGGGPEEGWIYSVDRFACMSDSGLWCIYCERSSELAIIGFRGAGIAHRFAAVLASVHAGSVAEVLKGQAAFELSPHTISDRWRDEFAKLYR